MKVLGYVVGVLLLIAVIGYFVVFFNPQSDEQEAMNAVWAEFSEEVAALGATIENAPFNQDDQTAAEGYRSMARYLGTFLMEQSDYRNADFPLFARLPNMVARIGWDNPDNLYLSFPVRGDHTYRLRGNVNSFDLITINVYSGMIGHQSVLDIRTISSIASDDLTIDDEGNFELILSPESVDGDWLKLEPDAYIVLVRRLVTDWQQTDEGLWEVVNLTTLGQPATRPEPATVAYQLRTAVEQARDLRKLFTLAHRLTFQLALDPNEALEPAVADPNIPMGDPFQAASRGFFKLAEDEVLVVEAPVADCRYTNIQLANVWMESLDYANHQSSLNNRTTHIDSDDRIRYVISIRDPGVQNWLDTTGLQEGSFCARWTQCVEYPTDISTKLLNFDELEGYLPADTPQVSVAERKAVITARQEAISRRYAGGS